MADSRAASARSTLWLLPLVFVIHDGEEVLTMAGWVGAHRPQLDQLAQRSPLLGRLVDSLATSTPQAALAIGLLFVLFLGVTWAAVRAPWPGPWLRVYAGLLGAFFLHAFNHVGQALLFDGYVPGLFGAVLAVVPGALFIYRRLLAAGLLSVKTAIVSAFLGLPPLAASALLALRVARLMVGH
jgi:hypothetical protein